MSLQSCPGCGRPWEGSADECSSCRYRHAVQDLRTLAADPDPESDEMERQFELLRLKVRAFPEPDDEELDKLRPRHWWPFQY